MNPTDNEMHKNPTTSLRANPTDSPCRDRRKVTHRRARSGFMEVAARAPVDNFTRLNSQPS